MTTRVRIEKGWSGDAKYCVTDDDGVRTLLRISPIEKYDIRKRLHEMMGRVAETGVPMCLPLGFGVCEEGVYSVQSWIDGEDAEQAVPLLPVERQRALGEDAGRILRRIHTIPAPDAQEAWEARFNRKMDKKIAMYHACPARFDGDEYVIAYMQNNRALLRGRPQCFQHGDYHIGNMMLAGDVLTIIDFDRFDFGDPWEEFNRIVWCAQKCPPFASGMVDGYFGGEPPLVFWKTLELYIASNTLSSVAWGCDYGHGEDKVMLNQARDVLAWYDGMRRATPAWYTKREGA